ncbi:hypothetical protein FM106_24800 [Brachybacterium faecium]|nr:hypothetical protein FM106_24800 [Brachybacterium faecium]
MGLVRSLRHVWLPAPGHCPRADGCLASLTGARRGSPGGMPGTSHRGTPSRLGGGTPNRQGDWKLLGRA